MILKIKKEDTNKKLKYSTEDLFVKAVKVNGVVYISNDGGFNFMASRYVKTDIKELCDSFKNSLDNHLCEIKFSFIIGSNKGSLAIKAKGVKIEDNKIIIER